MANLKDFRHRVAVLKKQGLLPAKTSRGNKLDARSAYPSWKVKGKSLSSIVKKYDDIASEKSTAVKVPRKTLIAYKKAGYETAAGRVIMPHSATERAVRRGNDIVIKSKSGIERVQIPIPFHRLEQWLTDIQKDKKRINRMKRRNEYFGFKFFGNNSSEIHSDIGHLIEQLQTYSAVTNAVSRMKQQEIYKNIEIVRISRSSSWVFPSERRRIASKKYRRAASERFRKRLKRKPAAVRAQYRSANAARVKAWRDRLKGSNKKKYKEQAKKRAKRSRKKK